MYYEKLKHKVIELSKLHVPITTLDRKKYQDLFEQNPSGFRNNATKEFYMAMREHVRNGKVWRINCSGKVRHGKSEVAQTWTMLYIDEFNKAITDGCYKDLQKQGIRYTIKQLNKLSNKEILPSQANYLYTLRENERTNKTIYGQPRIVDEDQDSTGGVGSYSERIELENINNITAQALQSEWQLRPDKFVIKNAPYGLHQDKMDRKNKVNWSMLYEFRSDPTRTHDYLFIGWVATPLHEDNKLRKSYNEDKKANIIKVLKGEGDPRLTERVRVATILTKDPLFSKRTESGKSFKLSKQQQESILNEMILKGEIQNFNSIEKFEIIEHARLMIEREIAEKEA